MSFGKSFDEAFKPANAAATAGAMDILKEKIKQNNETAQANNIIDYITARKLEEGKKSGVSEEELKASIKQFEGAKKLGLKPEQLKMMFPNELKDQSAVNVYNVGQSGELTSAGQVPHGSKVFKQALTGDEVAARSAAGERAKQEVQLDYPDLDDKGKSAVSAYKYISPRVDKLNTLIDSGIFGESGAERLTKQIIATPGGELIVPDGSPLEELVGLYNDIKLTGFNIAGTAFTGTEKETAFALLDPRAKSDKRIKRDLEAFQDLFGTRVQTAVGGLREAKKTAKEISDKKGSEPQYEYRTVNGKKQRKLING